MDHKRPSIPRIAVLAILTSVLWLAVSWNGGTEAEAPTARDAACRIEKFLPAKLHGRSEQIIRHSGYIVSYNPDWLIPNWVAYELTPDEAAGEVPRGKKFVPDPLVEGRSAVHRDYTNSGYDRGHMAPAADMKWSVAAMEESFYLSNICPQDHNLNGGDWHDLEKAVRNLAFSGDTIYVICGPLMSENFLRIGENGVAVPAAFFKILAKRGSNGYEAIAFVMPNRAGSKKLPEYAMSVDDLEILSETDFFAEMPPRLEKKAEAGYDALLWGINQLNSNRN